MLINLEKRFLLESISIWDLVKVGP